MIMTQDEISEVHSELRKKQRDELDRRLALPKYQVNTRKVSNGYHIGTNHLLEVVVNENVELVHILSIPGVNNMFSLAIYIFDNEPILLDNVYTDIRHAIHDAVLVAAHHDECCDALIRYAGNQCRLEYLNFDHACQCVVWHNEPADMIAIVNNLTANLTRDTHG